MGAALLASLSIMQCAPANHYALLAPAGSPPDSLDTKAVRDAAAELQRARGNSELVWADEFIERCDRAALIDACVAYVHAADFRAPSLRPFLSALLALRAGSQDNARTLLRAPSHTASQALPPTPAAYRAHVALALVAQNLRTPAATMALDAQGQADLSYAEALIDPQTGTVAVDERPFLRAEASLLTAGWQLRSGHFASVHLFLSRQDLPAMTARQRQRLIRLGERLIERSSFVSPEAADASRQLFASLASQSADDAVIAATRATEQFAESSSTWVALALARLKSGDDAGAAAALERARVACPFDPEPDYQLATLHRRRDRPARAVYFLRRATQAAPVWPKALWLLADLAVETSDAAAANEALQRLKFLYPDDIAVDLGRARTLLIQDQDAQALSLLSQTARTHPSDARAFVAIAKTALKLQEQQQSSDQRAYYAEQARTAVRRARELAPDSSELDRLQGLIEQAKQ